MSAQRAFLGTFLHTPVLGQLEMLEALIVAGGDGVIQAIHQAGSPEAIRETERFAALGALVRSKPGQYLLPGFVDLHVHAPQWPQLGKALDLPLEEWLQAYTFPLESRYADPDFAREVYESLVDGLLANGTTTAVYFGTLHLPATQILADICLRRSQRALVGRVAMDDIQQCPPYYRDPSPSVAEAQTRAFIGYVRSMPGNESGLIKPVITPRFIPSCSDELLQRLGALARETGCHVQTHCSESDWEHGYVIARCGKTDTAALDGFGLLSRHTILAHGNLVGDADIALIRQRGAAIAHCPLSNVYFSDAVFPLRRILQEGVRVGLGTDIAGGASPSILDNARHAVISSRQLESGVDSEQTRDRRRRPGARIDALTAFWLATAGGGAALDLPVGVFKEGFQLDAVLLDTTVPDSNLRCAPAEAPQDVLQKIIYLASRSNVREVWVANRRVHPVTAQVGASPTV
ncbi:MAG TPA: guanine deaminase [Steroidobacteraceae bacterium]|nr:guanine deaminase [Steroidobacteraceae bacterium]